jgi:hypothetical protein
LAKHSEAGKGDSPRPTNQKAFDEGFDRIFGRRILNQKMSNDDLKEYELNKSTGEVQIKSE